MGFVCSFRSCHRCLCQRAATLLSFSIIPHSTHETHDSQLFTSLTQNIVSTQVEAPWHAAYPIAKSTPSSLSRSTLLQWMKEGQIPGKDYVLVDLRRNDHTGGTISTSINLPAQSLHPSIPALYSLFKSAGVKSVVWYCGSSAGRGSRAAAWFADYITSVDDHEMQSLKLEGGIKGWVADGEEYVRLMEEYDESAWK